MYKIKKPIRLIELFAGVGSQAKALGRLGADFTHHRVVEFDPCAIKSYNAIHGTNFETSDITKITGEDLGIVDTDDYEYIMTYSFPCQDLSSAGGRAGMERDSGTRSGLLWEVERLLEETKELPQILLMENVPLVCGVENINPFNAWCEYLYNKGYINYVGQLNAKDYGVPQNRDRVFMVSILGGGMYTFPPGFELDKFLVDIVEPNEDVDVEAYYTKSDRALGYLEYLEERGDLRIFKSDDLGSLYVSVTPLFMTGIMFNYSRTLITSSKTTGFIWLRDPDATELTDKYGMRCFTALESWRLMGFDDEDYYKAAEVVSETQLYKQAGNSIVVNVLEEIFGMML